MTRLPPSQHPVRRINNAIRGMDLDHVRTALFSTHMHVGVQVCEASKDDWIKYVKSPSQALASRTMMWRNDAIFIVELSSTIHDEMTIAINHAIVAATGTGEMHLQGHGSAYADRLAHLEPDASFGPTPITGAVLPPQLSWGEFHTLKIEVGVSRGWDLLNAKAVEWATFPGVEYVLCVRLSKTVAVRQYKLFSVVRLLNGQGAIEGLAPDHVAPVAIVDGDQVLMNSRRLLGLPPGAPLPAGFADPNLSIELLPLARRAWVANQRGANANRAAPF
ncbi:hypothetical protein ACHHYP_03708 [Achlya hypogyna]|uniref:Uncharacterized protein n=1 Tax=Achlya hypogyna TaxID=1202772 RepID=A0A1V9Z362_ACHHY|nr:hypothetical protein ACHHYP_03708 [Achlya hypogyna]